MVSGRWLWVSVRLAGWGVFEYSRGSPRFLWSDHWTARETLYADKVHMIMIEKGLRVHIEPIPILIVLDHLVAMRRLCGRNVQFLLLNLMESLMDSRKSLLQCS